MFESLYKILQNPCSHISQLVQTAERLEIEEILSLIEEHKLSKEFVANELLEICKCISKHYRRFAYPIQIIPIPAYKFTKRPMISWEEFQDVDPEDRKAIQLRYVCSLLGQFINVLFPLRNFVHIDVDFQTPEQKELIKSRFSDGFQDFFDVETRRGFHKFFYTPEYYAVGFAWRIHVYKEDGTVEEKLTDYSFWLTIHLPDSKAKLDIRSSPKFLAVFPEQSHYLIFDGKELFARKYRCISGDCAKFSMVADVTPLQAKLEDIKNFIVKTVARLYPSFVEKVKKDLVLKGFTKEEFYEIWNRVQEKIPSKKKGIENIEYITVIGNLSYSQFKHLLRRFKEKLPNCVRKTFLEKVPKGYCYGLARLACTIIPWFVHIDSKELIKIAQDFAERFESFKKPRTYYWNYFMFSLPPKEDKVGYPSIYGIDSTTFQLFKDFVECDKCEYRNECKLYLKYVNNEDRGLKVREIVLNIIPKEAIEVIKNEIQD